MFKTNFYDKNLKMMIGGAYDELKKELKKLEDSKKLSFDFEFDAFDTINTNIKDAKSGEKIYAAPLKELNDTLEPFKKEFQRYPVLFFYGIGNGVLYKVLAQNKTHRRIIVFEPNLDLIYMALNLMDFSNELFNGQIIIVWTKNYSLSTAKNIILIPEILVSVRLYDLHIHSKFYEKFDEDIKKINAANINAIHSTKLMAGNDPRDALQGIKQYLINLPKMLSHARFNELIKRRQKTSEYAILVATGPSLTKQLNLLKKVQKKATIFSADSSYAILQKNGIKPDYVLSLERVDKTSELFNNDFKDYDEGITFLIYCLTHPNTIKYLERNDRNYLITQRSSPLATYLNFVDCGYVSGGMSVMNMAYQVAEMLGFKKIVLIGQDLAYGLDGASHPSEYMYASVESFEGNALQNLPKVTAYGGKGEVATQQTWNLFREIFESFIHANKKHTKSYNCTEGGARIEGAIEKPFKEICEILAKKRDKKAFKKIKIPSKARINEDLLYAYNKIKDGQKYSANFLKECKKTQKQVNNFINGKHKINIEQLNKNIDKIKNKINRRKSLFFNEILSPSLSHQEAALAPLYALNFENETDRQNKLMMWLYSHAAWIDEIAGLLEVFNLNIRDNIVPLREELEKRKLL